MTKPRKRTEQTSPQTDRQCDATQACRFRIEIELLEDLHSGSGLGSAVLDRILARNHSGLPIIPRSHVEGVWRDGARRLERLGKIPSGIENRLFGKPNGRRGESAGCLIGPELTAANSAAVVVWEATARRLHSRVPDDHSLRRSEYLAAGTKLAGTVFLEADSPDLINALRLIIGTCDRFGAERSRGAGQIRIVDFDPLQRAVPACTMAPMKWNSGKQLRLLLHAATPISIPTTGIPGNIINSERHIPGRTLLGAMAAWALRHGRIPAALLDRKIHVGPAYPLPTGFTHSTDSKELSQLLRVLDVMPVPLSLFAPKPEPVPYRIWPHWANKPNEQKYRDMLSSPETEVSGAIPLQWKRPKDDALLLRVKDDVWQRYNTPLELRMRNARGDSFEVIPEDQQSLFTTEHIPAGTLFVADLDADDAGAIEDLFDAMRGLFPVEERDTRKQAKKKQSVNGLEFLRVGRGGAPLELLGWATIDTPKPPKATPKRITLTTDTIMRDPQTLGFHPELTAKALWDALSPCARDRAACMPDNEPQRFSDSVYAIGFNGSTGLPQSPRVAIRRGSTLDLNTIDADFILTRLATGQAIGERSWEGHGRYRLDFDPLSVGIKSWTPHSNQPQTAGSTLRVNIQYREAILDAADQLTNALGCKLSITPSQFGLIRDLISNLSADADKNRVITELSQLSERAKRRKYGTKLHQLLSGSPGLITTLRDCLKSGTQAVAPTEWFLRALALHCQEE